MSKKGKERGKELRNEQKKDTGNNRLSKSPSSCPLRGLTNSTLKFINKIIINKYFTRRPPITQRWFSGGSSKE